MITKYVCGYCENMGLGGFSSAEKCLKHEEECNHNQRNKTCATCKHYDWNPNFDEDNVFSKEFWCSLFKDSEWRKHCDKHELK